MSAARPLSASSAPPAAVASRDPYAAAYTRILRTDRPEPPPIRPPSLVRLEPAELPNAPEPVRREAPAPTGRPVVRRSVNGPFSVEIRFDKRGKASVKVRACDPDLARAAALALERALDLKARLGIPS